MKSLHPLMLLAAVSVLAACREATAPERSVSITVQAGDAQFGTSGGTLAEPLQVIVTDPASKRPLENVEVEWRLVQGTGAVITPARSTTGNDGVATASVRLGSALGEYVIEATADHLVGAAPRFTARAVNTPTLTGVTPRTANTGDTITITGTNFSTNADDNIVLVGGLRARIVNATATQLRAVVPVCLPARTVLVQALIGAVASTTDSITVRVSAAGTSLALARAQAVVFADPAELACQRIPAQAGASYLLIPQNVSDVAGTLTSYELRGVAGTGALTRPVPFAVPSRALDFGSQWELRLRMLERSFNDPIVPGTSGAAFRVAPPEVGDKRSFKVYNKDEKFSTITAVVKHISDHAIIYQDEKAPANGFTDAHFRTIGSVFDSPTYDVDVDVFGPPSDIDADGKVIILLTPVVNELTPRGANGYVAGFFFGCDLQTERECSGSNRSEMFYLFVPDPPVSSSDPGRGRHGDARSAEFVMNAIRPVLGHEFQHMINFAARKSLDALWLAEGMAHMAEDTIGGVYAQRGELSNAAIFRQQNYLRARLYLSDSTSASLLSEALPGGLELRGGAWLLLKYLSGHYGSNDLLRRLTQSTQSSVQNITSAVGQPWSTIMSDWAVALWADNAPELNLANVPAKYTFPNINLRSTLAPGSPYPLRPATVPFDDFIVRGTLEASTQRHVLMQAGVAPKPVSLALTGIRGGPFALRAAPQITIFRVQ